MPKDFVLGVDGGNTKTLAVVAALDGRILGAGRGGCGDIYYVPPAAQARVSATGSATEPAALANIEDAVWQALRAARVQPSDLEAAVFNMAGADWPEDFALLQEAMTTRGFGRRIIIQNDALGVLHAGAADDVGVSVICGTGGATGARGPDGRIWHSSFWQQVQGGSELGRRTLVAVYHAELGIEPPTTLTRRVLDYFQMGSVEEVLHSFTGRLAQPPRRVSGLAPLLLDEAQAGDPAARRIVISHGEALGDYAIVAARRVGIEHLPFTLVLAGGVLRHPSPLLADTIIARVRTVAPEIRPTRPRFEPLIGVLFSALEAAGVTVDEALIERMLPTLPPPSLFETA